MRRNYHNGLDDHNHEDNDARTTNRRLLNNNHDDDVFSQADDGPQLQLQLSQQQHHQQQYHDGRKAINQSFHGGVAASQGGFASSSSSTSSITLTPTGMDSLAPSAVAAVVASNSISNRTTLAADPETLFPNKLFVMLHDAHQQGFDDIVSWGQDSHGGGDPTTTTTGTRRGGGGGAQFKVHKKRDFEQVVLPKYFKMTKYKSFTRQLHNYAFWWVRTGSDKGGYYHPLLDRNDIASCSEITRKEPGSPSGGAFIKGGGGSMKRKSSDEGEMLSLDMIQEEDEYEQQPPGTGGDEGGMNHHPFCLAATPSGMDSRTMLQPPHYNNFWQPLPQHPVVSGTAMPLSSSLQHQQHQQQQAQLQHYAQELPERQHLTSSATVYPEEQKLPPSYSTVAALSQSPHPHPLDSVLEPRTIEEMMLDAAAAAAVATGEQQQRKKKPPHNYYKKQYGR